MPVIERGGIGLERVIIAGETLHLVRASQGQCQPRVVALRKSGIERVERARMVCRDIVVHHLRVGPQRRGPGAGRGRLDGNAVWRPDEQRLTEKRPASDLTQLYYSLNTS